MKAAIAFALFAASHVLATPKFVSYIGQAGPGWGQPASNEEFLKVIGVPGYGGSLGYNVLNFAFWISSTQSHAANGAAYDWANINNRITSPSLRSRLTGSTNPSANRLRQAIKALYNANGIQIMISAFGGNDHPMGNGWTGRAQDLAQSLAEYSKTYSYDGVDVDWEEAYGGKFAGSAGGETWLCQFTDALRGALNSNQKLTHAPQAPYFGAANYPNGGYANVHAGCGDMIDWYNVQFYNQGSTGYEDFDKMFTTSYGWSPNTGVYNMIDGEGATSNGRGVPAHKLVVGKHTYGDGSTYVSATTLAGIFSTAIADGRWSAGFMSWQFYHEVYPPSAQGSALIHSVREVFPNIPTTPTAPTTPAPTNTPAPTTSTTASQSGGIVIRNFGDSTMWYYSCVYPLQGVRPGYTIARFEIRLANGWQWHTCDVDTVVGNYKCQNIPSPGITTPLSVRVTSNTGVTLTGIGVVESFSNAHVYDLGHNFADTGTPRPTPPPVTPAPVTPAPVRTPPPVRTPAPTTTRAPTRPGGGGNVNIEVTVREGSGAWWYTVTVSDPPNGITIDSVEMRHADGDGNYYDWQEGTLYSWGNYWVFNQNTPIQASADAPVGFRITASNGQVIVNEYALTSNAAGQRGSIGSLSSAYKFEDSNETGVSWTVWFAIFVIILCLVGAIVGFVAHKKRMKATGKGYLSNTSGGDHDTIELRENDGNETVVKTEMINVDDEDDEEVEIEVEIEEQMETAITSQ